MASLCVNVGNEPLTLAMLRKAKEVYVYVEMNELGGKWLPISKSEISKCLKYEKWISKYQVKGDSLWIG